MFSTALKYGAISGAVGASFGLVKHFFLDQPPVILSDKERYKYVYMDSEAVKLLHSLEKFKVHAGPELEKIYENLNKLIKLALDARDESQAVDAAMPYEALTHVNNIRFALQDLEHKNITVFGPELKQIIADLTKVVNRHNHNLNLVVNRRIVS